MPTCIKQKRLIKGYTQEETAKLLGISYYSYNKKEKGKCKWTLEEANKLKTLFNLTSDEIISYFFTQIIN